MGNPIRVGKTHIAAQGYDPAGGIAGYLFDAVSVLTLPAFHLGNITASAVNTTVQASFGLPQRIEIQKIYMTFTAGSVFDPVNDKFNLVVGSGAESAAFGSAFTVQAAGNSPFADQAIGTAGVNGTTYNAGPFYPSIMTAWYDEAAILTLRLVTSSASGTHIAANSIVLLLTMCAIDKFPNKTDAGSVTSPNF